MLCFSFSLPTTGLTESQPRCISRRTDYARETEAAGLEPLRSVTPFKAGLPRQQQSARHSVALIPAVYPASVTTVCQQHHDFLNDSPLF